MKLVETITSSLFGSSLPFILLCLVGLVGSETPSLSDTLALLPAILPLCWNCTPFLGLAMVTVDEQRCPLVSQDE